MKTFTTMDVSCGFVAAKHENIDLIGALSITDLSPSEIDHISVSMKVGEIHEIDGIVFVRIT